MPSIMSTIARLGEAMTESRRLRQSGSNATTSASATSTVTTVPPIATCAPCDLLEEIRHVRGDVIDDVQFHRFVGAEADGLADRLFGPLDIASPQLREAADVGRRVVDLLLGHRARPRRRRWRVLARRRVLARLPAQARSPDRRGRSARALRRRGWCPAPSRRCDSRTGCRYRRWLPARRSGRQRSRPESARPGSTLMMSRIAVSRPPGVSIFSTTSREPLSTACFRPRAK